MESMKSNKRNNAPVSVYRRGADDGFWFGIYLSLLFVSMAGSLDSALLGIAALAMVVAVPVVVYFFLKRSYRRDDFRSTFSMLWLHGICIFFFGSLLMALTVYLYLRVVNPSYIPDLVKTAYEFYKEIDSPTASEMAELLQGIQRNNLYPTAGGVAVEMIWSAVFTGSLLSMIISAIIKAGGRRSRPPRMSGADTQG